MRWHKVNDKKPETYPQKYESVIMWIRDHWYMGSWTDKTWMLVVGIEVDNVTHWAEVEPPTEGNTITE